MHIRSILVVSDFSAQEQMALQRAWGLADAHQAVLKLMCVPVRGQEKDPLAATRLANAASRLAQERGSRVRTVSAKPAKLDDVVAEARGVDLVVLPHRHERSTAAFFRGQPLARLLRRSSTPVLVLRRSQLPHYRRVLVNLEREAETGFLVRLAAAVAPSARLELVHALDARHEARLRGEHQQPGVDLVVVGKKQASAWEDFLCASVAHRVLSWGRNDALVVPEARGKSATALVPRLALDER